MLSWESPITSSFGLRRKIAEGSPEQVGMILWSSEPTWERMKQELPTEVA